MEDSSTHAPVRGRSPRGYRRAAGIAAAAILALAGIAGPASASAGTPAVAANCSDSATGSPGIQTFTLHPHNTCGFDNRAVTLCEPTLWPAQALHWAYGPWVYGDRLSVANCGGGTQAQLEWGYDTPTVYREIGHAFYY